MISFIKKGVNRLLRILGYEIKRKEKDFGTNKMTTPPALFEDVQVALHHTRGGTPASVECSLYNFVHCSGLNFKSGGWHPLVMTLEEYKEDKNLCYENSTLKKYYDNWQPDSACYAVAGLEIKSEKFETLPPYLIYLSPWSSRSMNQTERSVRRWHKNDELEHGEAELDIEKDGFAEFGPVSKEKGKLEFRRLTTIYDILKTNGYDRRFGDIGMLVLKRGEDYRYLNSGDGYHRTVAMAALNYTEIPARFIHPWIVSIDDIEYWPQVRNGIWNRDDAENYFNHLFDFDSYQWAVSRGLCKADQMNIK